ncbi:Nucleolar protein 14 [Heracleum sosnowskyi]|uniref:Nucleolar protein 14 n=1 Tax=Heracleum sosnowskyi TaxID=360622 RepID=A0AAD8H5N6_9APIA|nr:Nucleolar protein 14 [Heracleum sosnowskyi]
MVKILKATNSNRKDDDSKKKKKKNSKLQPDSIAMKKVKATKSNPFETIWSRRKFDVLGKKRKGEERRLGLARSLAIQKRTKTLLKDYEQSGKSSVFVDRRIGEQTEGLPEFDKAIMRSQRERQLKLGKKSKYNLSDGEDEDEFEESGLGSFQEKDDFEDDVPFEDDEDKELGESEKRSAILKHLSGHGGRGSSETGLAEVEENRRKTKKEVMDELISKSKYFKAQKAKDKEENVEFLEQLDNNFTSMVNSEALLALTDPTKINALKALVNKSTSDSSGKFDVLSSVPKTVSLQQEKPDSYDKLVNEMVLDRRARPSNRTKTPEEIAQEEKERLEQLEEERQKRMHAADDSSDEDVDGSRNEDASRRRLTSISGDDLGDSFTADDETNTKLGWINGMLEKHADEVESEEGTSSEGLESDGEDDEETGDDDDDGDSDEDFKKTSSLKDWEQSDDDKFDTDLEVEGGRTGDEENSVDDDDEDDEEDHVLEGFKKSKAVEQKQKNLSDHDNVKAVPKPLNQVEDLPYTIEAPKSLEELSLLLKDRSESQIVEAIRRIRTFNAISVAAENRKKMQVFYGVLLQYFSVTANTKPLNYKLLNLLVEPLMKMSTEIPYFSAICARQRLLRTRTQFVEDIKESGRLCWPSLKTLFLLRLWSMIFPCSDFRHVVMTPAILLMCEYLMRCPIVSGRDMAIGSFLCSMVLSVTKQSQKFCPEAIIFVQTLLVAALDEKSGAYHDSQLYHLMELKAPKPLLCIQGSLNKIHPLDFLSILDLPEDSPYFSSDEFRASILVAVIETLLGYINVYEGFNSFPEIFLPLSKVLHKLAGQMHVPSELQTKLQDVAELIEKKADEHHTLRRPLEMRKEKPVPIKLLNPKFEENFVKGRDYDPDRDRAEGKKLRKRVNQEHKGAARELRKDNYFLSQVKDKEKMRLEEERAEKYGKARAFLQEQEHAFKSGQLGKGKGKKRRR